MPELPEVETLKRSLENKLNKKVIQDIQVSKMKILKNPFSLFQEVLIANEIKTLWRRGKSLLLELAEIRQDKKYLLIHLRMTGQLIWQSESQTEGGGHSLSENDRHLPNRFTHIILSLENREKLFFNDQRQFGVWQLFSEAEKTTYWQKWGIEPLTPEFTWQNFREKVKNKTSNLKTILLNQNIISGLGNIYADEVCFKSGIRPDRWGSSLKEVEWKRIYQNIQEIISLAISQKGTTFYSFVDGEGEKGNFADFLQVYNRGKLDCLKCGKNLVKSRVAGRGTVFCPNCQK